MRLLIERNPDQLFLTRVLRGKEGIKLKHGRNKSEIIKHLTKDNFSGNIGIIDEDPAIRPPSYLSRYFRIYLEREDLLIYRNFENKTSIIVLRPRLEEFVLDITKSAKISPRQYGLPHEWRKITYSHKCATKII